MRKLYYLVSSRINVIDKAMVIDLIFYRLIIKIDFWIKREDGR